MFVEKVNECFNTTEFLQLNSLKIYFQILMGSRALCFHLLILTLPTGRTHVSFMKNKLSFWRWRELSHWAAGLPSLRKMVAIPSVHWAQSVVWQGSTRCGKQHLLLRTLGKATIAKEEHWFMWGQISHPWGKHRLGLPCVPNYISLDKVKGKNNHQVLGNMEERTSLVRELK